MYLQLKTAILMKLKIENYQKLLVPLLLLTSIWLLITEFTINSLLVGLPSIILATMSYHFFRLQGKLSLNLKEVPGFAWWFLYNSFKGGLDVSRRALAKDILVKPGFYHYQLYTPPGPARILVVNCVSLLPGTLSIKLTDNELIIHCLDTTIDLANETREIESKVLRLLNMATEDIA